MNNKVKYKNICLKKMLTYNLMIKKPKFEENQSCYKKQTNLQTIFVTVAAVYSYTQNILVTFLKNDFLSFDTKVKSFSPKIE